MQSLPEPPLATPPHPVQTHDQTNTSSPQLRRVLVRSLDSVIETKRSVSRGYDPGGSGDAPCRSAPGRSHGVRSVINVQSKENSSPRCTTCRSCSPTRKLTPLHSDLTAGWCRTARNNGGKPASLLAEVLLQLFRWTMGKSGVPIQPPGLKINNCRVCSGWRNCPTVMFHVTVEQF